MIYAGYGCDSLWLKNRFKLGSRWFCKQKKDDLITCSVVYQKSTKETSGEWTINHFRFQPLFLQRGKHTGNGGDINMWDSTSDNFFY